MGEIYIRPASPSTLDAIERLEASPGGPHLKLYRAVIEQDIRMLSEREDETEAEDDVSEDVDPREKIDIGKHPIEYYIYEVWARKYKGLVRYWIFSARYSMEDGDAERWYNEEATRAEAIAHVAEASNYEDAEDFKEADSPLDWSSKAPGEEIAFPSEAEILEYLDENE
jgi:hypothetical protein